ncbi:hypothetical protein KC330_g220, partial [Hortaea werneckii]
MIQRSQERSWFSSGCEDCITCQSTYPLHPHRTKIKNESEGNPSHGEISRRLALVTRYFLYPLVISIVVISIVTHTQSSSSSAPSHSLSLIHGIPTPPAMPSHRINPSSGSVSGVPRDRVAVRSARAKKGG